MLHDRIQKFIDDGWTMKIEGHYVSLYKFSLGEAIADNRNYDRLYNTVKTCVKRAEAMTKPQKTSFKSWIWDEQDKK